MTQEITLESISEKLFDNIFNNEKIKKTKLVKDALPIIEEKKKNSEKSEAISKAMDDFFIHRDMDRLKAEIANNQFFFDEEKDIHKKFDSFDFRLNKRVYSFKRDVYLNISIKIKPDDKVIDKKYSSKVSENIDEAKNIILEMAQKIPFYDIADTKYDSSSSSYMTTIFSSSSYSPQLTVVTDRFIELVEHFKELFTQEELYVVKKYQYRNTQKAIKNLNKMFERWIKFLKKGKYTSEKPYEFNDLDNEAFVEENDTFILMSQKSQNTLFAYIKEKETGRIKVFNYAMKKEFNHHEEKKFKETDNYLALFKSINNHYSYESYSFDLESKLYPRFLEYYMNNFETTNNMVYDSKYGFNLKSHYIKTLEEDFELFNCNNMFY